MTRFAVRLRPRYVWTRFAVRTIGAFFKGLAYLLGGLLFGALPLLAIIAWKVLKGGAKVTLWTFAAVIVLIGRAA